MHKVYTQMTIAVFLLLFSLFLWYYYPDKAGTPFAPVTKDEILESHHCREIQVPWIPAYLQSGSPVTSYLAEAKEQNSSEWLNCTAPCGLRECTIKGLKSETEYIVRVSAENSRGRYGNLSPIRPIRTDPTGNLATIVFIHLIYSISLSWLLSISILISVITRVCC